MNDCRFVMSGISLAALALSCATYGQECTMTPLGVEQNDATVCAAGEGNTAADPNAGCNIADETAIQAMGNLADGSNGAYGNVGYDASSETYDSDWYSFTAANQGTVSVDCQINNVTQGNVPPPTSFMVILWTVNGPACDTSFFDGYYNLPCGIIGEWQDLSLPAGDYYLEVSVYYPDDLAALADCTTDYVVDLQFEEGVFDCGDPAQGTCVDPNGLPGCADYDCCQTVCEADSVCCDTGWDQSCVDAAWDLCGYFQYECENPVATNDCVANATPYAVSGTASEVVPFDTAGCNTDGPPQEECGSGAGFEQLNADVWYAVTPDEDGFLGASTCGIGWDTKIALYDFTTEGEQLEELFITCNEDCDPGGGDLGSNVSWQVTGGVTYLVRVGGYDLSEGSGDLILSLEVPPSYTCEPGEPNEVHTQNVDPNVTGNGVFCWNGTLSFPTAVARKYMNRPDETIGCSTFGVFNFGSGVLGDFAIYEDDSTGDNPVFANFQLIDTRPIFIPGGGYLGEVVVSFDVMLDVIAGMNIVCDLTFPGSPDSVIAYGCNELGETSFTYIYWYGVCGPTDYVSTDSIGFGQLHWVQNFTTWDGGGPGTCIGDINEDGVVDGADLTMLLGSWGTSNPAADLNGDGTVGGADLTILLGGWGPCP